MNIATPALGPSFGVAPAGTWTWMSDFSSEPGSMPRLRRARLDQRERRLRALLHHVAELAGEYQLAAAGHARRLDEEDVAAHRRPGEAGRHAGHAVRMATSASNFDRPEDGREVARVDR